MPPSTSRAKRRRKSLRPDTEGWRASMYDIIFEADSPAGRYFDIGLLVAILLSITIVSLETVPALKSYDTAFETTEWILTGLFTVEYVLRLICVRRPLRYAFSFWGIVDLLSILPSYITLIVGESSRSFVIIRSIRLLRVFRVLKLWRMMDEADELSAAIWRARNKIVVFLAVVLVAVTISGTLMYHIEMVDLDAPAESGSQLTIQAVTTDRADGANGESEAPFTITAVMAENLDGSDANSKHMFTSIPQAMYWAIVTMTTVGYGDIVPKSAIGKTISAILILLGYSLIIVPSTFIGAEFVKHNTEDEDQPPCNNCNALGHKEDADFCYRCGIRF